MKFYYQLAVLTITLLLIQVSYVYAGNSTAQLKSKGKAVCGPSKANSNSNANKNKATGAGGNNNAAGVVKDVPNTPPPCTDNSESTEIIIDGQAYYCTVMNGSRRCYKY